MVARVRTLLWQVPLCVIASMAGSLAAAWLVSQALGLTFNAGLVAMLSAALSASVIAVRLSTERGE